MTDKVTRQCPQTTTFLERKEEPKRRRTEVLSLTNLPYPARPNRLTSIQGLCENSSKPASTSTTVQIVSKGRFNAIPGPKPSPPRLRNWLGKCCDFSGCPRGSCSVQSVQRWYIYALGKNGPRYILSLRSSPNVA